MAQRFQPGDIVYHKSNLGTTMTVHKYTSDSMVVCNWVDASGDEHQHAYHENELFSEEEADEKYRELRDRR